MLAEIIFGEIFLIYKNLYIEPFNYRVHGLKLMHFRQTFFHDLMTFLSKAFDFWDPEMGRFDIKHFFFFFHQPHMASTTPERKGLKNFKGGGCGQWRPNDNAMPLFFRLRKPEY